MSCNAPGNVEMDEQQLSYVQTRFPGWIQNVFANATYQYVKKGQRLFTIYSPDLVSTEQEYLLAKQNQNAFASGHARHGGAEKAAGCCRPPKNGCGGSMFPLQRSLTLEQSGKVQREIAVESPASGYIIERNALPNAYVQPDTKLYTIADLSTVWVYANVSQNDVGRLKPGDPAQVTVDAYPGRTSAAASIRFFPRWIRRRARCACGSSSRNPGVVLKPGMYVNVDIAVPLGRQLVIPASAVLQSGSRADRFHRSRPRHPGAARDRNRSAESKIQSWC